MITVAIIVWVVLPILFSGVVLWSMLAVAKREDNHGAKDVQKEIEREAKGARAGSLQGAGRVSHREGQTSAAAAVAVALLLAPGIASAQVTQQTDAIRFDVEADVATATAMGKAVFVDGVLRTEAVFCSTLTVLPASAMCETRVPKLTDAKHTILIRTVYQGVEKEISVPIDLTSPGPNIKNPRVTRIITITLP